MKIPFGIILGPILKSNFSNTRLFCQHSTLSISVPYTFVYSTLGVCINAHHLKKHLGEIPLLTDLTGEFSNDNRNAMLDHDLKIIAMSMGLLQYSCLLAGCFTENPSLFLPYLAGQLIIVCLKIVNASILLIHFDTKAFNKFRHKLTTIALMMFNWFQGFCVFRKHLCICDL